MSRPSAQGIPSSSEALASEAPEEQPEQSSRRSLRDSTIFLAMASRTISDRSLMSRRSEAPEEQPEQSSRRSFMESALAMIPEQSSRSSFAESALAMIPEQSSRLSFAESALAMISGAISNTFSQRHTFWFVPREKVLGSETSLPRMQVCDSMSTLFLFSVPTNLM